MTDTAADDLVGSARRVDIPFIALVAFGLLVIATILVLRAIDRAQQILSLAAFAGVLAGVLAPAIRRLGKVIGQTVAALIVHLVVLVVLVAGVGAVLQSIRTESTALEAYTEARIAEIADGGSRSFLDRTQLDERVGDAVTNWGTVAVVGEDDAGGIATRLSEAVIVIVLSIFLSLQGDLVTRTVLGLTSDRERRRWLRAGWQRGSAAAGRYLRRSIAVGLLSGAAAGGLAAGFGLPAPFLVGVWAALLSTIPLLGAVVGWAPVVVLAVAERSSAETLLVAALAISGVIAVNALRARIVTVPVKPGSFLISMAVAAGLTAIGIPGAIAAVFLVVGLVDVIGGPIEVDDLHSPPVDRDPETHRPAPDRTDRHSPSGTPPESVGAELVETATADTATADVTTAGGPADQFWAPGVLTLTLTRRTAYRITAFVIGAYIVQLAITRIGPIVVWAIVGVLLAVGLDRPVSWFERRWKLRRSHVVIVGSLLVALVIGGLASTTPGSLSSSDEMANGIPELVDSLVDLPLIGDRLAAADLESRLTTLQNDAPRLIGRSPLTDQAVGVVSSGLIGAFWIILATLTCLLDGPRLVMAIDRRIPARFARQTRRLSRAGQVALGGYVAGSALVAAMNGTLVVVLGILAGVPLVAALGLWAFTWNFIPQIGAIIGWAPLVILAFLGSPAGGLAVLLVFILYQAIENNAIQPTIVGHAVDIPALAALGAALMGAALGGLVGAALAIPVAGVGRALYREVRSDDFPRLRSSAAIDDRGGPKKALP